MVIPAYCAARRNIGICIFRDLQGRRTHSGELLSIVSLGLTCQHLAMSGEVGTMDGIVFVHTPLGII